MTLPVTWPHGDDCRCATCDGARDPSGPLWRTLLCVLAVLGLFVWLVTSS